MTRDDAVRLVKAVFRAVGQESPGLNEKGFGGLMLGLAQVFFEHQPPSGALLGRAHIYTFRKEPRPGALESLQAEENAGTNTGGGSFEFIPENRGAFLTRAYAEPLDEAVFVQQIGEMGAASLEWRDGALQRAFEKARG